MLPSNVSFPVKNNIILKYITIQNDFIHTLALNLYQFCWEYTRGLAILVGKLVTHGTKERLSIFPAKIFKTFCSECQC